MTEHQNSPGATAFRDYVKDLPHAWIFDNLLSGGGSRGILSSAMVKDAAAKFSAKPTLVKRFKALTPAMRVRCSQVYLTGGGGLSLPNDDACAKEPLLSSLLVFAARSGQGGAARLFGFNEFEPALRPLMAQTLADSGATGECAPGAPGCPWRPLNDVAAVAALAFHGALRRSNHGGLSRTALNALKKLTLDPTLTGRGLPDGDTGGHPAGFLIGYCLKEDLIADADMEYAFNRQRFAAWLEKSMKERMARLASYADEFLDGFNLPLLREILKCGEGRRMAVNCMVPEPERPALTRAAHVLEFFGCLHSSHSQSAATLRFSAVQEAAADTDKLFAARETAGTIILPDFSVLLPQESSPAELFNFSMIGLLTGFDKVYGGQITRESINNSLGSGTDPGFIRDWLRSHRAANNVIKTADEWIREFERLFICCDATLITADEKVTRAINSFEPLRKYLEKIPAHTVYRIKPGSEQKALDILEKLGFDTRDPGENADASASHSKSKSDDPPSGAPARQKTWSPITDFTPLPAADNYRPQIRGTKYGSRLKPLEVNEMIQAIDYAMLTNQSIIVDYAGCLNVKQSVYTAMPIGLEKGLNAIVEVLISGVKGSKQLYLSRIKRIGVVAQ